MGLIKSNMPCLPCILVRNRIRLPSVQHVVEGRKRLGHQATYASCEWHHFGMPFGDKSQQWMSGFLGPSLAHGKRTFQEFFGPERLLVEIQDELIKAFESSSWIDYSIPYEVRREAFHLWTQKKDH